MSDAREVVSNITPSGGWWLKRTPEVMRNAAVKLLEHGFDEDEASDLLVDVINAIKEEYGD